MRFRTRDWLVVAAAAGVFLGASWSSSAQDPSAVDKIKAKASGAVDSIKKGAASAGGAIKEKFTAGEPCDVVILTGKLLQELDSQGLLLAGSTASIGLVRTGVAVPAGHPVPDIATGAALRASMMAASRIYVPDPIRSTAGIHIVDVLKRLGIEDAVMPKLQAFPNGETAMRSLSEQAPAGALFLQKPFRGEELARKLAAFTRSVEPT